MFSKNPDAHTLVKRWIAHGAIAGVVGAVLVMLASGLLWTISA